MKLPLFVWLTVYCGRSRESKSRRRGLMKEEMESSQDALVVHGIWTRAKAVGLRDEGELQR